MCAQDEVSYEIYFRDVVIIQRVQLQQDNSRVEAIVLSTCCSSRHRLQIHDTLPDIALSHTIYIIFAALCISVARTSCSSRAIMYISKSLLAFFSKIINFELLFFVFSRFTALSSQVCVFPSAAMQNGQRMHKKVRVVCKPKMIYHN